MFKQENFPTFITLWKSIAQPKRVVRPSYRRPSRRVATRTKSAPPTFVIQGTLSPGSDLRYCVEGEDFVIDDMTWVFGELVYGSQATVHGTFRNGGERYATKIVISK